MDGRAATTLLLAGWLAATAGPPPPAALAAGTADPAPPPGLASAPRPFRLPPPEPVWLPAPRRHDSRQRSVPVRRLRAAAQTGRTPQQTRGTGTVCGRLLDARRPMANCRVALIPLRKGWTGYRLVRSATTPSVVTDAQGVFRFERVPPGPYKLTWLPPGDDLWIRRLALRPDVVVTANETSQLDDIHAALRTIN